jgi:hypothetical protein
MLVQFPAVMLAPVFWCLGFRVSFCFSFEESLGSSFFDQHNKITDHVSFRDLLEIGCHVGPHDRRLNLREVLLGAEDCCNVGKTNL